MKCEPEVEKQSMKNLFALIIRKKFTHAVTIGQKPDEVFNFLKDPKSWYRFDFHEVLYIEKDYDDLVITTKSGRGVFEKLSIDPGKRSIHYIIDHFQEGKWKFAIKIASSHEGSQLHFSFAAPSGLPPLIFQQRTATFKAQLENLKALLSKSRATPKLSPALA